jgi:hypothetical protein
MKTTAVKERRKNVVRPRIARLLSSRSAPSAAMYLQRARVRELIRGPSSQGTNPTGRSKDSYQHESDAIAHKFVPMPTPLAKPSKDLSLVENKRHIQRLCPACEDNLQRLSIDQPHSHSTRQPTKEQENIRRKRIADKEPEVDSGLESGISSLRQGGQALPGPVRSYFEPRFGYDFSAVRIHNDARANRLTGAVNARAFTLGQDVAFGKGQYSPGTKAGNTLLAHELTHVIQQSNEKNPPPAWLQRAVRFKTNFKKIKLKKRTAAAINDGDFTYEDAEFSADAHIKAVGNTEAELNQWDVGILQDMVVNWEREYWRRNNTDRKGNFVEQKFKWVNKRFRDQEDGAATVWSADDEHKLLKDLPKTPKGSRYQVSTKINTSDEPGGEDVVSGSAVPGMDASDGNRNIKTQRIGTRFDTYISAHNTATGAWRHLKRLNWNYMRSLDFKGSGATLAIGPEKCWVGKHGPYGAGRHAPKLSGDTANTAMSSAGSWYRRRVKGWT